MNDKYKKTALAASVFGLMLSFISGFNQISAEETIVVFQDPAIEKNIRYEIGREDTDPIYESELQYVRELNTTYYAHDDYDFQYPEQAQDLSDLKYLPNLVHLTFNPYLGDPLLPSNVNVIKDSNISTIDLGDSSDSKYIISQDNIDYTKINNVNREFLNQLKDANLSQITLKNDINYDYSWLYDFEMIGVTNSIVNGYMEAPLFERVDGYFSKEIEGTKYYEFKLNNPVVNGLNIDQNKVLRKDESMQHIITGFEPEYGMITEDLGIRYFDKNNNLIEQPGIEYLKNVAYVRLCLDEHYIQEQQQLFLDDLNNILEEIDSYKDYLIVLNEELEKATSIEEITALENDIAFFEKEMINKQQKYERFLKNGNNALGGIGYLYIEQMQEEDEYMIELSLEKHFILGNVFESQTFTVTFDTQGGSTVLPLTEVEVDSLISRPEDPTKEGYEFVGWSKQPSKEDMWNFDTEQVTDDMTLYAIWEDEVVEQTFTVTFDSQGGSSVSPLTDVKVDSIIIKPSDPVRQGYEFVGWSRLATNEDMWAFDTDKVSQDTTLFAVWELEAVIPEEGKDGEDEDLTSIVPQDHIKEPGNADEKERPSAPTSDIPNTSTTREYHGFIVLIILAMTLLVRSRKYYRM